MKKEWGIVLVVVGILLMGAGFYPLRREVRFEEKGVREETWWREETGLKEVTKTREESYTEDISKNVFGKEILLKKSVTVPQSTHISISFNLKEGDKIIIKAQSTDNMFISFFGFGMKLIFVYMWTGKDYDREFKIDKDGEYTLTYSSFQGTKDIVINFDIVRMGIVVKVEKVQKSRMVEYTEQESYTTKIPYTTNVPYTIITEKTEKYNIEALRYVGLFLILAGAFIFWKNRKS
jgi:uncharacterized protein YjeT (DUF2065 family)